MKLLLFFFMSIFLPFGAFAQTGGNMIVQHTVQNNTANVLYIYQTPDLNGNIISSISPTKTAMVCEISFGNGAIWGKIDMPSDTNATSGYVVLDCANAMTSVITFDKIEVKKDSIIGIYSAPSLTSAPVLIGSNDAKGYEYQRYAIIDSQGGWYKIDLPSHCSQNFGWVQNDSSILYSAVSPSVSLPTIPNFSTISTGNSSIIINGNTSINTTTLATIACANDSLYSSRFGFPDTVSGLQSASMYQLKFLAMNSFGFSCASACVTAATAGNIIPVAGFTPSDLIVGINQSIDFNNTSTNASTFSWNFGDGTTSTVNSPTHAYTSIGNYTVSLVATSPTGHTNTYTQPISVVTNPPTGVTVDNLIFNANTFTGGNIKTASGNVGINIANCSTALRFGGDVVINKTTKRISGNCTISVPNVQGQIVDLYQGPFDLKVKNDTLEWLSFINKKDSMQFEIAGMRAFVRKSKVICDGVAMRAVVDLPNPITNLNGKVLGVLLDTVVIRQNTGVDVGQNLFVSRAMINHIYPIDSINLSYSNDEFSGEFILQILIDGPRIPQYLTIEKSRSIPMVTINCSQFINDIPIQKLNLKITTMNYCNFSTNFFNTNFNFSANIEPIKPNELLALGQISGSFRHTMSNGLYGLATVSFCGNLVTNAHMESHKIFTDIKFWGPFQLEDFLDGNYSFHLTRDKFWHSFKTAEMRGYFDANIRMPNPSIIQNKTIRCLISKHYQQGDYIALTKNHVNNYYLCGIARIPQKTNPNKIKFKFSYYYNLEGIRYFWFAPNCWAIPRGLRDTLDANKTIALVPNGNYHFTINNQTPSIMIEATGIGITPEIVLYISNGDSITSTNIDNYPNIIYLKDSVQSFASFWWANPPVGDYQVKVINADTLDILSENVPPSIKIQNVQQSTVNKTLAINWTDNDPDDDAMIAFFLDKDREGADGMTFIDSLSENSTTDSYLFNYNNFPTGDYYVGALIKDTSGMVGVHYFATQFRILGDTLPNKPILSSIAGNDTAVVGVMNRNNTEHLTYLLYYSPSPLVKYTANSIVIPDNDSIMVANLIPHGRIYYFAVSAVDSLGRESELSNVKSLNYISATLNDAPYFQTQNLNIASKVNTLYSYQLLVTDADNDPLTYTINPPITGLSISNTGLMTWLPTANELGIHRVNIKVNDPSNAADSISFDIYVRDSFAYSPDISFDKNTFFETNDAGIITISDEEFVTNYNTLENINVRLFSNSDMTGITIQAKETSNKSKEFITDFETGTTSVNTLTVRQLQVAPNDTIWAEYVRGGLTTRQIAYVTTFLAQFDTTRVGHDTAFFVNQSKGYNLYYSWDFGDGTTDSVRHTTHKYTVTGTYTVTLTVTDAEGRMGVYTKIVVISSLSPFGVEWLSFQGIITEDGNLLNWKTANEVNNDKFVVERSTNNLNFSDIGSIDSDKNVGMEHNYQFIDTNPAFGKQYYRIRQIDIDGKSSHSNTVELTRLDTDILINLYPNPTDKEINVSIRTVSPIVAQWTLLNATGITLKKGEVEFTATQSVLTIPITDLASGTYYLRLSIDGKVYSRSIQKQ